MSALPTDNFVRCQYCGAHILRKNLKRHLQWVHAFGWLVPRKRRAAKIEKVAVVRSALPPAERRECLASSFGTILVPPARTSSEVIPVLAAPGREICPRCGGDGGVRGGCDPCDGTGWVRPPAAASACGPVHRQYAASDLTRVTNANYIGNNLGAHFRDRDGRIGSLPDYDDYSENGFA